MWRVQCRVEIALNLSRHTTQAAEKQVAIPGYRKLSPAIEPPNSHQWLKIGVNGWVVRMTRGNTKLCICRDFEAMELGGFEPPTSWVR
jgi:hypothetical protein